jgi:DNA polymerase I-like protein with 3'-5' exonuclease and polymerase domains
MLSINYSGKPEIIFVFDHPSPADYYSGKLLTDSIGSIVSGILECLDVSYCVLFALDFVPEINDNKSLKKSMSQVVDRIIELDPKIIVTFGSKITKALIGTREGIKNTRGVVHTSHGYNILPTYNPYEYAINNDFSIIETIKQDILLAEEIAIGNGEKSVSKNYYICDDKSSLRDCAGYFKESNFEYISSDYECKDEEIYKDNEIICCGVTGKENEAFCLRLNNDNPELNQYASKILTDILQHKKWIMHNAKFELACNHLLGINPYPNHIYDTMLLHYLYDERLSHKLKDIVRQMFPQEGNYEQEIHKYLKNSDYRTIPFDVIADYNCHDADLTLKVFNKLYPELRDGKEMVPYGLLEQSLLTFHIIEKTGMNIDLNYARDIKAKVDKIIKDMEHILYSHKLIHNFKASYGTAFNVSSPKMLQYLLYGMLKIPVVTTSKLTGLPSTDMEAINYCISASPTEEIKEVLSFIKTMKEFISINSKILAPIEGWKGRDGRVHSTYNLGTTKTGRLSSSAPNLQNISAKETILSIVDGAPVIRNIFSAIPGHKLIELDIAQAELRILAHESQDANLLKIFREGKIDMHMNTAKKIFGDIEITKDMRRVAKSINFGVMYGITAHRVSEELEVSLEDAQQYIDTFFASYPGVMYWITSVLDACVRNGFCVSQMGRIRRFSGADFDDYKEGWKRQAINHPIQSLASDIVLVTVNKTSGYYKIVNEVHDSIMYEVPNNKVKEAIKVLKNLAEIEVPKSLPFKLSVPWLCDIKIGERWGEMKDEEKI